MGGADTNCVFGNSVTSASLDLLLGTAMAEHVHAVVRQLFQLSDTEALMYELVHNRMSGTYEIRLHEPRRSIMYAYEKHIMPPTVTEVEPQYPPTQRAYRHLDLG